MMPTPPNRRQYHAFLLVAVLAGAGCGVTAESGIPGSPPPYRGADISALERLEQGGAVFRLEGVAADPVAILQDAGANLFRLRLFVAPGGQDVQVNDLAYTVRLAGRVAGSGADLLLDLHYSDTWADPAHQETPAAWAGLAFDSLERTVEVYTADVVAALRQAGALPAIVQVGNEIDGGMLWPAGRVSGPGFDTPVQWDQFTRLLKAAIRGIHGALGPQDSVRIMLHYSRGADSAGTRWFFDWMEAYGVSYDVIGLSYYPWWHGTLAGLRANLAGTAQRYGRDVMVVETSYPWRAGGWEGMVSTSAAMTWTVSSGGQSRFLADVMEAVGGVPGGRGAGVLWWYPEAVQVPGLFVWGGGSLALFDAAGNLLPAAGRLRGF